MFFGIEFFYRSRVLRSFDQSHFLQSNQQSNGLGPDFTIVEWVSRSIVMLRFFFLRNMVESDWTNTYSRKNPRWENLAQADYRASSQQFFSGPDKPCTLNPDKSDTVCE